MAGPAILRDSFAANRIVVFVGAGVSTIPPTTLLSWWDVNEQVVKALAGEVQELVGSERAQEISRRVTDRQHSGLLPPEYQAELVAGQLRDSYFRVLQHLDSDRPNRVHLRLARLAAAGHVAAVVTTNFDRALETAFGSIGSPVRVCVRPAEVEALAASLERAEPAGQPPVVLKLHGSADLPDTIIDTLAQRKRGFPPATVACLRRLLGTCHWLFLGYSGADLEADPGYLQLSGESARASGFTWLFRPGSQPGPALEKVRALYGDRAAIVTGELPDWLDAATAGLIAPTDEPPPAEPDTTARRRQAQADFAAEARAWAHDVGLRPCALALASVLSAVGEPEYADDLLARLHEALARDAPGSPELATAASALAAKRQGAGRYEEARALYTEAIAIAEGGELSDQAPWLRNNLADLARIQGDLEGARAVFEEVLDVATRAGDDTARGVALHNLALVLGDMGDLAAAARLLLDEIEIVRRLGDEPAEGVALTALGNAERQLARYDDALAHLERALAIRQRLGDDIGSAYALGNVAGVHNVRGDLAAAARIYTEGLDLFTRLGDRQSRVITLANLGQVSRARRRYREALVLLRDAVAEGRELGLRGEVARARMHEGAIVRDTGDPPGALAILEEALATATAAGLEAMRGQVLNELALTFGELGQVEEAERAYREAAAAHEQVGDDSERATVLGNLALLEAARGDSEAALALHAESIAIRERLGQSSQVVRSRLNLANLHLQFLRLEEARAGFAQALEGARSLGLPAEEAYAILGVAYALGLQGRVSDSLRVFAEAEALAADLEPIAVRLAGIAEVYRDNGHAELAAHFAGEAARLRRPRQG